MAAKRYAVVLSDVHIGNGAPTCWYQPSVHERPLTEVLKWILARREVIREVILLGDLFDVWTYPPSQRPPSMADIIAANRTLLGPSGPLAAVARAFPGEVRMLLGNHDGSLTRADIDLLNRSLGARIELIEGPWRVVDGTSGARTVFETIDDAIARGVLPPAPRHEACDWCDFKVVCGTGEERRTARKVAGRFPDLDALRGKS